ncbi:hypothetical protein BCR42DRAFT_400597 [Absidia repens]|uniref:Uncharacterized protein n=1 Tax=Absidia repens TaxID=90262 RepID=A0A1X2J1F1_9FUNG|nr:hypothetical protein BCR42DRAFT_400597 [Absidia repens]
MVSPEKNVNILCMCIYSKAWGDFVFLLFFSSVEPTSALDPESTLLVEATLKTRTCIWITHNPQQEARVATKSLVIPRYYAGNEQDSATNDSDNATEITMFA